MRNLNRVNKMNWRSKLHLWKEENSLTSNPPWNFQYPLLQNKLGQLHFLNFLSCYDAKSNKQHQIGIDAFNEVISHLYSTHLTLKSKLNVLIVIGITFIILSYFQKWKSKLQICLVICIFLIKKDDDKFRF